ncbi:hypothetical protein [Streptomyces sp. NPDC056244]|uniref:hypothetical protein n=1 Tax=Streptomyces sp. NPDC056244 TaxID=3345762 RepID=UPI0035DFCF37
MTTITEQLHRWKDEGGPGLWRAAWGRTISIVDGPWDGKDMTITGPILADGAAAMTTVFYILSSEQGTHPDQIGRAQVEEFHDRARESGSQVDYWESRLTALGHDLHHPLDPVSVTWQRLRFDYKPSADSPDDVWEDTFTRWGPGFIQGLDQTLAPLFSLAF